MLKDRNINPEEPQIPDRPKMSRFFRVFWELIKTIITVAILTFLIRYFLIQPYIVDGESMAPNFHHSEYLLTDKLSYRIRSPQRGDVIIFHPPDNLELNYIKRIIGAPGDSIKIQEKKVYLNGKILIEPYLGGGVETLPPTTENETYEIKLGPAEYFVLGDNRSHSKDSRDVTLGPIPELNIVGRALLVVLPPDKFGLIKTPSYSQ